MCVFRSVIFNYLGNTLNYFILVIYSIQEIIIPLFCQLTLFQDKTWLFYCDMNIEGQKYLPRRLYKMLIIKKNYKFWMVTIKN